MGALKSSHRENRTAIQPLSTLNPTRVPGITRGILWTSRDRKSPVLHPPARKLNRNFRFTAPRQSNRKRTLGTRRETNPTAKPITWQAFKDRSHGDFVSTSGWLHWRHSYRFYWKHTFVFAAFYDVPIRCEATSNKISVFEFSNFQILFFWMRARYTLLFSDKCLR